MSDHPLRWCLPLVQGRGSGLGNELLPWARAWLMAREIGATCLAPGFGRNERGYTAHFGGWRGDGLLHHAMARLLPRVHFGHAEYRAAGGGDAGVAFAAFARERGLASRAPLVVTTDGLWGGVAHVQRAREFVRATLYASRFARTNVAELAARLDPERITVALHVRLGDFAPASPDAGALAAAYRGRFNVALPLAWFVDVVQRLRQALADRLQFQVFSDAPGSALAPLHAVADPVDTRCNAPADVSDLLAMARADLLVCSVSSYSLWAAALSDAPYLWFAPQLQRHEPEGALSIWGHEKAEQAEDSTTRRALRAEAQVGRPPGRAFAHAPGEPLPAALLETLVRRADEQRASADLVRHGVLRRPGGA